MPLASLIRDPLSYAWVPQYILARLRGFLIRVRHLPNPRVRIGAGLVAEAGIDISGPGLVRVGRGVKVRRSNSFPVSIRTLAEGARVSIGDGSELGGVQILCGREVSLGERTLAANCRIQDTDFSEARLDPEPGVVRIGKGVWLGLTSLILKQAEIGDWSIVGAGSVVERAVEPLALALGNPARPFRGVVT